MSKRAFDKIAEGLNEALAIAKGDARPAKLFVPPEISVKSIRQKLQLSQDDFAAHFGFSINQIKDWEQGRSRPIGGVRAYLMLIERNPAAVLKLLKSIADEVSAEKVA
ncbi:MAG TPA: transcriptional regulator [Hyphomicrobiaceae bacterium]|nr:transcriptional regulator [Hyphomicrobiaceae bacterium]